MYTEQIHAPFYSACSGLHNTLDTKKASQLLEFYRCLLWCLVHELIIHMYF